MRYYRPSLLSYMMTLQYCINVYEHATDIVITKVRMIFICKTMIFCQQVNGTFNYAIIYMWITNIYQKSLSSTFIQPFSGYSEYFSDEI